MATALRTRSIVKGLLAVVTLVIFILSTHINLFMGFFYIADRFPFVLAIITALILVITSVLDAIKGGDVATSRPVSEIVMLGILFIIWTSANAFSTPRWAAVQPGTCSAITIASNPAFESSTRVWCREMIALRAFVWIEWVIILAGLASLLVYCIKQTKRGSRHVWSTPLAVYDPNMASAKNWSANNRVFSQFSFYTPGEMPTSPYPFATQHPIQKVATPMEPVPRTFSAQSHDGLGPAVMGYQLDPFNVSKERPISLASSGEGAVQPVSWRMFAQQGFDNLEHRAKGVQAMHHRAYSTSVDHHPSQAYAF